LREKQDTNDSVAFVQNEQIQLRARHQVLVRAKRFVGQDQHFVFGQAEKLFDSFSNSGLANQTDKMTKENKKKIERTLFFASSTVSGTNLSDPSHRLNSLSQFRTSEVGVTMATF